MEISDLIQPHTVFADLKATSKKQALQELARRATTVTGCSERDILDVLIERERLGTTGIGKGIAIPHGKLPGIDRVYGIFAKLNTGVDFDSMDNLPVDLLFLLLAPESAGAVKSYVAAMMPTHSMQSSRNQELNPQHRTYRVSVKSA